MLVDFYEANEEKYETARMRMDMCGQPYPQMKLLYIGFWQIGFESDDSKGYQIAH